MLDSKDGLRRSKETLSTMPRIGVVALITLNTAAHLTELASQWIVNDDGPAIG